METDVRFKKVKRTFRLEADLDYMIPALIKRKGLKETPSGFIRKAVQERFMRLASQETEHA